MIHKQLLSVILISLAVMSFKSNQYGESLHQISGIYGDASGTPVNIQLILNKDFSFHYIHDCNPKKPIDVKGTWILLNNTVILKDYKSDVSVNDKWRIDKNTKCLKSRHGMEFIRICQISQ